MFLAVVVATALATPVAGALAREGDPLPGAVVERVEVHSEYERYWLRYPSGALVPAEVTRADAAHEGLCGSGGLDLYPREDFAQGPAAGDVTGPMTALCGRLAEHPPHLRDRVGGPGPVEVGGVRIDFKDGIAPVQPRPLLGVVGLLALASLAMLGVGLERVRLLTGAERVELGVVAAASVAARFSFFPPGIFNGEGAAYEKIVLAWGVDVDCPYGDGFPALFAWPLAWLGRSPEVLFGVNRLWASAAPVLLWVLGRQLGSRGVGLGAGLLLAVWPAHVRLSATEAMHVPVTTLLLVALVSAAAVRMGGWRGVLAGLTAGLAGGVAAHVRPEAILAVIPVAVVLWGARGLPIPPADRSTGRPMGGVVGLAVLAGLAAWRAWTLDVHQDVLRAGQSWMGWVEVLRPRLVAVAGDPAFSTFWHAAWTPAFLWGFAILGVFATPRRVRIVLLAWWLALEVPVLEKATPLADALRLQLPTAPLWALLCGFGVDAVARRMGRWTMAGYVLPVAACAFWLGTRPDYARWAEHDADAFLRGVVPTLEADAVVLFDDRFSRAEKFQRVMQVLGPARWMRGSAWLDGRDVRGPTMVFRGVECKSAVFDAVAARCRLVPVERGPVTPATDRPMCVRPEVVLYRVESCP